MKLKQKTFKEMTEQDKTKNPEYAEFLEKFETKLTTDDCFTPANIYECIASYVVEKYNLNPSNFVRPFYPGGDYENYEYPENCVVVDNPPFSILSKIVDFYVEHDIKFFLFAPTLMLFNVSSKTVYKVSRVVIDTTITYANGAKIATSFVTNCENIPCIRSAPDLDKKIKEVDKLNSTTKKTPKYTYPDNVLTASDMKFLTKNGVELCIELNKCQFIRRLDDQIKHKKVVYGGGHLVSDDVASALAKATAIATANANTITDGIVLKDGRIEWQLSERELDIIKELNSK